MIIDVGANIGEFALSIAKRNPFLSVIAIEPIPDLCNKIQDIASSDNIQNVKIIQCAVDIIERVDYLNVASHHDWGVSSLLHFDQSKIKNDDYWKTRSDMYFDTTIEVQVRSLESILHELAIEEQIDFIKIDAQGLDFNVLKSVGKYIHLIQAGMLEVSVSTTLGLYENETYDLRSVLNWLEDNGFTSYALKPNDPASNEFNLYFCKKGIDYHNIELTLSLKDMHLYDGKFYWHFPSSKLEAVEERLVFLEAAIETKEKRIQEVEETLCKSEEKIQSFELLIEQNQEYIKQLEVALQKSESLVSDMQNKILFRLKRKIKKIIGVNQ